MQIVGSITNIGTQITQIVFFCDLITEILMKSCILLFVYVVTILILDACTVSPNCTSPW